MWTSPKKSNTFRVQFGFSLFYCDSTLGCRVIQDFDFCKLDDLMTQNDLKSQKMVYHWRLFRIELKLCTVVTVITKFHDMSTVALPWQHNGLEALSFQNYGKIRVFLFQKVLLHLQVLFIQWVWANKDNKISHSTSTRKSVRPLEQQIRIFWEGRGLIKSLSLWLHHKQYCNV